MQKLEPRRHEGTEKIGLYHEDLTDKLIAAAIEVHKHLGPGLLESAYEQCYCHEITLHKIPFERQLTLPVEYKGVKLDLGYRIDLIADKRVVIEFKCVDAILPIHEAQLLTYMKLSGMKVGLIINFHSSHEGRNKTCLLTPCLRLVRFYENFSSPKTTVWTPGTGLRLFAGSYLMPAHRDVHALMNDRLLFNWVSGVAAGNIAATWWFFISLAGLVLLTINTFVCSYQAVRGRWSRQDFLLRISPQVVHIGFLFILLAHLLGAGWGYRLNGALAEGASARVPDDRYPPQSMRGGRRARCPG
jgi:GxxExxY protein